MDGTPLTSMLFSNSFHMFGAVYSDFLRHAKSYVLISPDWRPTNTCVEHAEVSALSVRDAEEG